MSILIKGLKLPPVGIRQCIVSFADNCLLITDVCGKILFEGEYVEIPTPHGDLVDRDDLTDEINRVTFAERYDYNVAYNIVTDAETIIEAEVSDNA